MSVPSRSRKTAADSLSAVVILEAGDQLRRSDGGGPEFGHDDRAGVIGNFRRLDRGSPAAKRQSKKRNRGIASTVNVEDLPRLGRNMMWCLAAFEQHHALFTQSNKEHLRI